jgi:hypothetical protein
MTTTLRNGAFALALLGGAAFFPASSFALEGDVDIEAGTDGAEVEIQRDRPALLPDGPIIDPDADVYVETPEPDADVYVEEDDDDVEIEVPGPRVEIDRD